MDNAYMKKLATFVVILNLMMLKNQIKLASQNKQNLTIKVINGFPLNKIN